MIGALCVHRRHSGACEARTMVRNRAPENLEIPGSCFARPGITVGIGRQNRDRGEPRDSSPPTPPYIRVRIRRFTGLSANGFLFVRARGSDSGHRRVGFGCFEQRRLGFTLSRRSERPATWIFNRMATRDSHIQVFQRSGLQRNSFRLLCRLLTSPPRSRALRLAQSAFPDATEISRGKIDRLPCTPAGFTTPSLDDHGLRDDLLARPAG